MEEHHCVNDNLDVRSVANLILNESIASEIEITNFVLNKTIFLIHSDFLHKFGRPLVSAKIEAWEHGPVFREIYYQFKNYGKMPIKGLATRYDFDSDSMVVASENISESTRSFILDRLKTYATLSFGFLYEITHRKDGAWNQAFHHKSPANFGMEITNELILNFEPEDWRNVICRN